MDVSKIKRTGQTINYGMASLSGSAGGSAGDNFREQMGHQLKDDYKKRFDDLFDEMNNMAEKILNRIDLSAFEKYRGLIRELLSEISKSAYVLSTEFVTDRFGRRRVFESISIIDTKLDGLAKDILSENSDKLDYISRVDEIRGLVMDMLL